ncbi:Integrator complex subunit 6 [Chamberlinius hualienensis]
MTVLGNALKNAFDVLNINRMQTRIDTYGQGRCPFYLEPSLILVITDGGKLSSLSGVLDELNLPMHNPIPGSELTKEPFRWDQRLFSLVLRLAGTPSAERDPTAMVPPDNSPIDAMCEVTGGRSYCISSQHQLMQCLESLVQKVQSGVVINFEKIGPDPPPIPVEEDEGVDMSSDEQGKRDADVIELKPELPSLRPNTPNAVQSTANNSWHSCRKLIYVPRSAQKGYSVGHWPIPEGYWPDANTPSLPPRTAHPIVKFTCQNHEPMIIDNLPFDKYELEPSPLTQYILSRKQPTTCWQVFITNSHKNTEVGHPFGYLKASTNLQCVNLFVMPYNYPALLPLLDELFKVHRLKPTKEWRQQFDNYLKNMPLYYASHLKRALQRMGAPSLVPENLENYLSYSVLNYLKRLTNQAKAEFEKMVSSVGTIKSQSVEGIRVIPRSDPRKDLKFHSNSTLSERFSALKEQIVDYNGLIVGIQDKDMKTQSYRNPFDIPRITLLDQIARMRANFLQSSVSHTKLLDDDQLHNMPVSQMGNYQEYLKRTPQPLREIESQPVRQHMFGNPFKIDKRMMVDEMGVDIDLVGTNGMNSPSRGTKRSGESLPFRSNKRKPGPLPRDVLIRRPITPPPTPPSSPSPSLSSSISITSLESMENITDLPMEINNDVENPFLHINGEDPVDVENEFPMEPESNHNHLDEEPGEDPVTNHVDLKAEEFNSEVELCEEKVEIPVVNHKSDALTKSENNKLKHSLYKELRKPGRNFRVLFEKLNSVQGNLEVRVSFIREIIREASRFKRKSLVVMLEKFERTLVEADTQATAMLLCNHKQIYTAVR